MREKVLNSFKSRFFPIKNLDKIPRHEPAAEPTPEVATEPTPKLATEATPTKHKKAKLKLLQEFINEIIADENNVKDLISTKQNKNEKYVNNINNRLIDLRNDINRKEIPENENPKNAVDIVENILDFNKQQRDKGLPSDLAKHIKI